MSTLFHVTASFSSSWYGLWSADTRCLDAEKRHGILSSLATRDAANVLHEDCGFGLYLPPEL